jgi:murein DD-endopeptidase MepM/ murein hydrolase activator NlpD
MTLRARHGVAVAGLLVTAVAGSTAVSSTRLRVATTADALPDVAVERPTPGERWFDEMLTALERPVAVEVPFVDSGPIGERAAAFAFEAAAGQTLELTLERETEDLDGAQGRVYVEVFRVIDLLGHALRQRLAALTPTQGTLRTRLPSDGAYSVLVQPEDNATSYRLTIELAAALPFPVVGAKVDAIRSTFGASRDAGRRPHQGIDIYANRLTPVLAVAAGTAMPRTDQLGGNAVWLNTPGISYYYAHLDRIAVRDGQRVRAGDILGYIGNTGNAGDSPAHLHFGVYRWGKQPVDPLPLLTSRRLPRADRGIAEDAKGSGRAQRTSHGPPVGGRANRS